MWRFVMQHAAPWLGDPAVVQGVVAGVGVAQVATDLMRRASSMWRFKPSRGESSQATRK
jgi:hypothetical protein